MLLFHLTFTLIIRTYEADKTFYVGDKSRSS